MSESSGGGGYLAHSKSESGHQDPLVTHLTEVASLAEVFAGPLGMPVQARLAGLLHDLGKYGELFRKRLADPKKYTCIDHWSAGAWAARLLYKADAQLAALAMAGHHLGLPWAAALEDKQELRPYPEERELSEKDHRLLLSRFKNDGLRPPAPTALEREAASLDADKAAAMLDARMLFSCLVDADYLATEAHFQAPSAEEAYRRPTGPKLLAKAWLELVLAHVAGVASLSQASAEVMALRADLLQACLDAAAQPPGLYTLAAPTGSGKTLAMLAFALKHAQAHGLRRVVTVIPYLTIIEQTVKVYRQALADLGQGCLDEVVLEHHSLAGGEGGGGDDDRDARRLLAENWDAPLVVTTNVQFLESLFANRPGACRKLHRLAGSVILLDEVQTLPTHLAEPTLATLSRLAERYGATVVMATATQPAFERLDGQVRGLGGAGWRPREITRIANPELSLFKRVRRVEARWPEQDQAMTWAQVAQGMLEAPRGQALGVVNLKRHAVALFQEFKARGGDEVLHLSTNLCPAHREAVLAEVRRRLETKEPCLLVSTQCVEAGVDLDFPVVWRAWGPLEAMAQAAGRCNRGGRLARGELVVFAPEEEKYPDGGYGQAAAMAKTLWRQSGEKLDLDDPEVFLHYYKQLYLVQAGGGSLTPRELAGYIHGLNFPKVAQEYRIIDKAAVNVLVPYNPADRPGLYDELVDEAHAQGFALNRSWLRRARRISVSLYRPSQGDVWETWLEQVPVRRGHGNRAEWSHDWFILRHEPGDEGYDNALGLLTPKSSGLWIA